MPASPPDLDAITSAVLASRRYRWIDPALVRRLAGAEWSAATGEADAIKRVKRRLHQVCGAYVDEIRPEKILDTLAAARASDDLETLQGACRQAMAQHASTRERLPVLERFYRDIFAVTGPPRRLLDLACGFGPLALPWMDTGPDFHYTAYDIDQRIVATADGFLSLCGTDHHTGLHDVTTGAPSGTYDVALLLKAVPCLEQQAPGVTRALLSGLDARAVAVSFPTRSLGGTGKGMESHYRAHMERLLDGLPWTPEVFRFPLETVYVLHREALRT